MKLGSILSTLLTIGVLGGGGWLVYDRYVKIEVPKIEYRSEVVARGRVTATVTASGTLSPLKTVQVGSQVSGRIVELFADFNSEVKKGDVIARIDPSLLESDKARSRANLQSARASLTKANADRDNARLIYERTRQLVKDGVAAQQEVEAALTAYTSAKANAEAAGAAVAVANAAIETADTNLLYTTIVSPIDGVVISRDVSLGQTVAASLSGPPLAVVAVAWVASVGAWVSVPPDGPVPASAPVSAELAVSEPLFEQLRALAERGIVPDVVIGCSIGALNGAAFAADPTSDGVAHIEEIWRSLGDDAESVMPGSFLPNPVQLLRRGHALHSNDGLRRTIDAFLGDDLGLVVGGREDDAAVLGGRDVPLQALEDDEVRVALARREELRVGLLQDDLVVLGTPVVGNHAEVEPAAGGAVDLLDHLVAPVDAVLGVDVVVAGQPQPAGVRGLPPQGGRRPEERGGP